MKTMPLHPWHHFLSLSIHAQFMELLWGHASTTEDICILAPHDTLF